MNCDWVWGALCFLAVVVALRCWRVFLRLLGRWCWMLKVGRWFIICLNVSLLAVLGKAFCNPHVSVGAQVKFAQTALTE